MFLEYFHRIFLLILALRKSDKGQLDDNRTLQSSKNLI